MNKAVFLDRDGTINRDFGYVYQKDKLEFLPGVLDTLKKIRRRGYKLIIITNQSGIGRKYFTLEQYREFESYFLEEMKRHGAAIDGVYFCPHSPEEQCTCRKPLTGMFHQAAEAFDVDWKQSYAIGDKERDLAICEEEEITGILYGSQRVSGKNKISICSWEAIGDYILGAGEES